MSKESKIAGVCLAIGGFTAVGFGGALMGEKIWDSVVEKQRAESSAMVANAETTIGSALHARIAGAIILESLVVVGVIVSSVLEDRQAY